MGGCRVLVGLTGTPGTGKSAAARLLGERGISTCSLARLAASSGAQRAYDAARETWDVDLKRLAEAVPSERPLVLVGHVSHLLGVDVAIVLRCHPEVLRGRLAARGWPRSKVEENVEAEALGVILGEARERADAYEVDTTTRREAETARAVSEILEGRGEAYRPGSVDWSEVILGWF